MCARIRVPFGFAPGGGTFLTPRSIRRKHLMHRARGASRPGDAGSARLSHAPREQCKKSLIGACGRHAPPRTWTPALRNRQRGPMTKTPFATNPATKLSWWQLVLIGVFTNASRPGIITSRARVAVVTSLWKTTPGGSGTAPASEPEPQDTSRPAGMRSPRGRMCARARRKVAAERITRTHLEQSSTKMLSHRPTAHAGALGHKTKRTHSSSVSECEIDENRSADQDISKTLADRIATRGTVVR